MTPNSSRGGEQHSKDITSPLPVPPYHSRHFLCLHGDLEPVRSTPYPPTGLGHPQPPPEELRALPPPLPTPLTPQLRHPAELNPQRCPFTPSRDHTSGAPSAPTPLPPPGAPPPPPPCSRRSRLHFGTPPVDPLRARRHEQGSPGLPRPCPVSPSPPQRPPAPLTMAPRGRQRWGQQTRNGSGQRRECGRLAPARPI